jgi:hypothetical protein
MGRFETEAMTQATNLNALAGLSGQWIDLAHARRPLKIILLDMDSSVSPTFGESRRATSFSYRAASWDRPRPVVAKVKWHTGELYPRVGFLVTNLSRSSERVVAFYNERGTAEQWIKEGKNAVKWTRLCVSQ